MRSSIWRRPYLFHFHTDRTDGELSLREYFEYAVHSHIETLVFLEHIRRKPSYDVEEFACEVRRISHETGVPAIIGFETKLLQDGNLDIAEHATDVAEVIGIAEHGFPPDKQLLRSAFNHAVESYRIQFPQKLLVWAHPGLWFRKRGVDPGPDPVFQYMLDQARERGVMIEQNLRYGLAPTESLTNIAPEFLVLGADAHNYRDLERWTEFVHDNKVT